MGDRGRQSSKADGVATGKPASRPKPPRWLSAKERATWQAIVDDYPANHFRASDLALLGDFVYLGSLKEKLAGKPRDYRQYSQVLRDWIQAGQKLRIWVSNRKRNEDAGLAKRGGKRPWER